MHHFALPRVTPLEWKDAAVPTAGNAYADSKLAAVLFSVEINRRYGAEGITAIAVNPGAVNSDIWRGVAAAFPFLYRKVIGPVFERVYLDTEKGSATSVAAALCQDSLPPTAKYLQPYILPSPSSSSGSSHVRVYGKSPPTPVFEMLGVFGGYSVASPRLPGEDGGEESAKGLWEAARELTFMKE